MRAARAACCLALAFACARDTRTTQSVWQLEPTRPLAGAPTLVRVTLRYADGEPVIGAVLTLEAHMSHPGMPPVTAPAADRGNGLYESRMELSMPGDWTFVLTGRRADGGRVHHQLDVPTVAPVK